LAFSYSYRIDPPNYQSLNLVPSYLDSCINSSGTEYLKPQYTQSLELRHAFKDKIFTSLSASYIIEPQSYVIHRLDEKRTRRMHENTGKSEAYSITLSFPARVQWLEHSKNLDGKLFQMFLYLVKIGQGN
jgi:Outer membrane protein beta-barrel family